ncbi:MAG: oligosaccharide flippase family protein [Patescibacteria group bacterium]
MFFRERVSNWFGKISGFLGIDLAYVLKGGSFLTLGNFAAVFSNFILAFFFARLLPKEVYGTYGYILAWISVIGVFALPGMDKAVIQSVSNGFESSLVLGLKKKIQYGSLGTLAALILGAYYFYNGNQILAWAFFVGAIFIPFVNSFQLYNAFLLGKKEFKTQTIYLILSQLFISLTLITAIFLTQNIVYLVGIYLLANLIPSLIFFFRTRLISKLTGPEDPGIISFAKHLSLINVVSTISGYLDQFLAFHFLGPANLATYTFAIAPPEQIKGLFQSVPDLALPKFSQRSEEELKKTIKRKSVILFVFAALVVLTYVLLAPWFYKIFFPRYLDSVFLSQIFALSMLNTPATFIIPALTAHKKIKKLYWFNIISPIFQISAMTILTPLYGLMGLILARVVARTFTTVVSLVIYYKT